MKQEEIHRFEAKIKCSTKKDEVSLRRMSMTREILDVALKYSTGETVLGHGCTIYWLF